MFESLKLADIHQDHLEVIRKSTNTRPVIYEIEENGTKAVVKDFSQNGVLFRNLMGRFIIWRETRAYSQLRGVQGVPAFFRSIDGLAIVTEAIPGNDMESITDKSILPRSFFKDLQIVVDNIHERGMAHCDLKRAPNIILGDDGKPYIVDWSASISKQEFRFFLFRPVYNRFIKDDINAITKLRLRYDPESVGPEEKKRYYQRSFAERFIRYVRDRLRDFLQKIA